MQASSFRGIWIPIVTPFGADGAPDLAALARLARWLAGQGIAGFVSGATTGEGVLLDAAEQADCLCTLREAVPGLPVVAGVTQASTAEAVAQAQRLRDAGADGLLVTPPVYVRPSQGGVRRHFEAVTEATDRPVVIYDIPYRTGVSLELATLQALATDRRVAAIKACGATPQRLMALVQETPLAVLCGDDALNFTALCAGAPGIIAASAHVRPDLHRGMLDAVQRGDLPAARRIAMALAPVIDALFAEPNPAPVKAWLAADGWCADTVRLPFEPASAALRERLQALRGTLEALDARTGLAQ